MVKRGDISTVYEHEKGCVMVVGGLALIVSDPYEAIAGIVMGEDDEEDEE